MAFSLSKLTWKSFGTGVAAVFTSAVGTPAKPVPAGQTGPPEPANPGWLATLGSAVGALEGAINQFSTNKQQATAAVNAATQLPNTVNNIKTYLIWGAVLLAIILLLLFISRR
jgi:hypothetical protein